MINTRVDLRKLVITCLVPVTALLIHNIVYLAGTRICDLTGSQTDSVGSITSCISYILCICIFGYFYLSDHSKTKHAGKKNPFLRAFVIFILLLILVGGIIGAISYRMIRTMKMPVEYESVSKLYITFNQDENGDVYQYYNGYTWNELLDTDPILIAIMNHLTGYEEEEVKDAASAEILSDIRLLTITVKGDSEKMVREIQAAVEEGLADYADQSEELRKIVTIRSDMPKRIYWSDDTTKALIAGAVLFGLVSFFVFGFMYVLDDGVYVQADVERRYPYKALGIMTRNQKGLQPFVRELKADLLYVMGDSRDMLLLDMDNHGELRQADMDKLLNWEEGGTLGGDKDIGGELVWHVRKEDEDEEDEDILPEPKEWKITVFNESDMGEEQCAAIRKNGGVILLIPFGNDVSRKTERMLSFLKNQDCNVYGIIVTEADEEYLNRYFA